HSFRVAQAGCVRRRCGANESPVGSPGDLTPRAIVRLVARVRLPRWVAGSVVLIVLTGASTATGLAGVRRDRTPPAFGGSEPAPTWLAAPLRGQSASSHLRWNAATDNVPPSTQIVSDVSQATTSGGEDFAAATYTPRRGATTFTTPALPA